jgi:hypothetical protein
MMVIQSRFQHTAPPVGPPVPEPKTFKEMMKHYGKPFVAVYLALCTASFGVIYGGILYTDTSAADIIRKVRSYGIISDMFLDFFDRQCEKHPSLSTAIAAYLLAQCTDPLRIVAACALTPPMVRRGMFPPILLRSAVQKNL